MSSFMLTFFTGIALRLALVFALELPGKSLGVALVMVGWSFSCTLGVSMLLRLGLMLYGEWQDRTMVVKFTDVDYYVFTDAARFVTQGMSPYLRPTYRYTPLLAWLLQPNIWFTEMFGKVIFIVFDILTGYLIYDIVCSQRQSVKVAHISACVWLLNPLTATVSSRGNAESVMSFLVLLTLKFLYTGNIYLCAMFYALSIHFKIYPITYALPIYLKLKDSQSVVFKSGQKNVIAKFIDLMWPTRRQIEFGFISGSLLLVLTGIYYHWYGWEFLQHTYLYHIGRTDIRHNFSVYFYMLYLTAGSKWTSVLSILLFIPQFVLLIVFSVKYYKDPSLCWFLNTLVFVTFNKVCTSQYFLWYLCMLPLLIPHLQMTLKKAAATLTLWLLGQGIWLMPAYFLEFEGFNTFLYIWAAGCLFFSVNVYIIIVILISYHLPYFKKETFVDVHKTVSNSNTISSEIDNMNTRVSLRTRSKFRIS